jgi:hypothetical protein
MAATIVRVLTTLDHSDHLRRRLGALALSAIALGVGACAGSGGGHSSQPAAVKVIVPNYSTHNNDRDNDGDHNDDDAGIVEFGQAAGPADRRASIALVTRYFAAAAAADGAADCRLLVPIIAESVGEAAGTSERRSTCALALSRLFRRHRAELALKRRTLRVSGVRVSGSRGLLVLYFPTIPEVRQMTERRVGNHWRLITDLDGFIE